MKNRLEEIDESDAAGIVGDIISGLFQSQLLQEIRMRQEKVVLFLESCWIRYRDNLRQIEQNNEESKINLDSYLEVLGYAS